MKPRILIVEDEEALATLLRYNLEKEGFEVETVVRGDEADTRLMMESAYQALDRPTVDNQAIGFENPNTRHRGDVTVLRAFDSRGRTCKELQVHTEAQGRKGDNKLYFCSVEGKWRLVGDSQL